MNWKRNILWVLVFVFSVILQLKPVSFEVFDVLWFMVFTLFIAGYQLLIIDIDSVENKTGFYWEVFGVASIFSLFSLIATYVVYFVMKSL